MSQARIDLRRYPGWWAIGWAVAACALAWLGWWVFGFWCVYKAGQNVAWRDIGRLGDGETPA